MSIFSSAIKRRNNMTIATYLEASALRSRPRDREMLRMSHEIKPADGGKALPKGILRKVIAREVIGRSKGCFPAPALKWLEGNIFNTVRNT